MYIYAVPIPGRNLEKRFFSAIGICIIIPGSDCFVKYQPSRLIRIPAETPLKPQKRFVLIGSNSSKTKEHLDRDALLCWQLPIFPGRRQPSIFGTTELNFCVRNGNRWTLCVNVTNLLTLQDRVSIENRISKVSAYSNSFFQEPCSSSIRSISIGQLNALLRLHLRPIKLVVCK